VVRDVALDMDFDNVQPTPVVVRLRAVSLGSPLDRSDVDSVGTVVGLHLQCRFVHFDPSIVLQLDGFDDKVIIRQTELEELP